MSTDPFWPDSNVAALRAVALRLGVAVADMVAVMANESACLPNPPHNGPARGLIQFEPETLRNLGWHGTSDEFTARLGVAEQLPFVERYFEPYARKGLLVYGTASLYTAAFLPALLAHAGEPRFVLCAVAPGPLSWAYAANRVFDRAGKGSIIVQDMSDAAARALAACKRAQGILATLAEMEEPVAVALDVTDGGADEPIFVAPPINDSDKETG